MGQTLRRSLLLMLCLCAALVSGCGTDRKSQLVGTWKEEHGVFSLLHDGTFTAQMETGSWGILVPTSIRVTGTWAISGNDMIFHITHSTHESGTFTGMEMNERILAVENNCFRTKTDAGKECVYTRIN